MDNKILAYIAVGIIILLLILSSFGMISFKFGRNSVSNGNVISNKDIPEECKVPAGQDLQAWKEDLGHHENTKYCLDYYK